MEAAEKVKNQNAFMSGETQVIVATSAFGMGVDKADIRTVVHLEPSPTAESYIQEAGRGGRDKKLSKAILLWSRADSFNFEKFAPKSRERVLKNFAEAKS